MSLPTILQTAHGPLRLPAYFPDATRAGKYNTDSEWGHFLWWRDKFFGG